MTRVLSALVLIPVVVGVIWFLPPIATLILAEVAALLAFIEYAELARALGVEIPRVIAGAAVLATLATFANTAVLPGTMWGGDLHVVPRDVAGLDIALLSVMIVIGCAAVATRTPGPRVLQDTAAAVLPVFYIAVPLGALVAIRMLRGGRPALMLLLVVIVVSDSAQYYTGRLFGRHPLSAAISPKKTIEGAIGGLILGTGAFVLGSLRIFPFLPELLWLFLVPMGVMVVAAGMVGDLFESLLKRSAGVKDSSGLIPGHGGVLDRIDSWLFAAPIYYVFVRYLAQGYVP